MDNQEKKLGEYWTDFLQQEFLKETDRGAVVLTASLLENTLTNLLKNYLVPSSSSEDELFDNSQAPISTFSAKIKMAERLGLISTRLSRDLNLIRKIRNEFAHNIHGSTLNSGKIKELLTNLTKSSKIVEGHEGMGSFPPGVRGEFLKIANIMLFHLNATIETHDDPRPLSQHPDEWIYSWAYEEQEGASPPDQQSLLPAPSPLED